MTAHFLTALAYFALGIVRLYWPWYQAIVGQWQEMIAKNPAVAHLLGLLFGLFIMACAVEHTLSDAIGKHHPVTEAFAWFEAVVSIATAVIFIGIPVRRKWAR